MFLIALIADVTQRGDQQLRGHVRHRMGPYTGLGLPVQFSTSIACALNNVTLVVMVETSGNPQ